jgi:hypothetical protein
MVGQLSNFKEQIGLGSMGFRDQALKSRFVRVPVPHSGKVINLPWFLPPKFFLDKRSISGKIIN